MATGKLSVQVVNGRREQFDGDTGVLFTVRDGMQKTVFREIKKQSGVALELPVRGTLADRYTVLASTKDHADGGFTPVTMRDGATETLELMLVPRSKPFVFETFDRLASRPDLIALLDGEVAGSGQALYERVSTSDAAKPALACLLNITTALDQMVLVPHEDLDVNPLKSFKALDDEHPPAQDRCFAWADARLLTQMEKTKDAKGANAVSRIATAPAGLHKGATKSFKQIDFGEANVQLSFHEFDPAPRTIKGVTCLQVDVDIDYFQDTTAHLLGEVFPNKLKKLIFGKDSAQALTDPRTVYGLRWTNGRRLGREFNPPYVIA